MQNFTLSCEGTLVNGTIYQMYDIAQYYESTQLFQYELRNLFPNSEYTCTIDGCTNIGCGPNTTASNKTGEYCESI